MGVDSLGTLPILHIPTVVSNRYGYTVIIGFSGTYLGTKFEVGIGKESLLDTTTTVEPVKIDSPNSVLPPPDINRCTKSVTQSANTM